jgi:hypothetical protein
MPKHQTGLIIIRAWVEPGSLEPLRTHIRLTSDIEAGFESERTFAGVPSVLAAVELWLRDFRGAKKASG